MTPFRFEEDTKKQLLNNFQEMEKKTTEIFNEMKGIVKNIVSATSETFDYNLDNNEDVEIVNVTENDEIPKKPVNKTPNTTNNDEIVKNSEISVNNFSLLESNVAGNPFVFLVLLIVFLLMIVGNNFSKKR